MTNLLGGDQTTITKTFNSLALTGVVALGFSACAANAATVTATAKTSIIKQITVTKTANLDDATGVTGATASTLVASAATLTLAASNALTAGGALLVDASQAKGVYTGTFIATVSSQ